MGVFLDAYKEKKGTTTPSSGGSFLAAYEAYKAQKSQKPQAGTSVVFGLPQGKDASQVSMQGTMASTPSSTVAPRTIEVSPERKPVFGIVTKDDRRIADNKTADTTPNETETTLAEGVVGGTEATGRFAKGTGQSIARGSAVLGSKIAGVSEVDPKTFFGPGTEKLGTAIFGKSDSFTAQDEDRELFAAFGLGDLGEKTGGNVTLALAMIDALPGGSFLTGTLRALKGAKTIERAAEVMKKAGFADNVITEYAPRFAATADNAEIASMFKSAVSAHKGTEAAQFKSAKEFGESLMPKRGGTSLFHGTDAVDEIATDGKLRPHTEGDIYDVAAQPRSRVIEGTPDTPGKFLPPTKHISLSQDPAHSGSFGDTIFEFDRKATPSMKDVRETRTSVVKKKSVGRDEQEWRTINELPISEAKAAYLWDSGDMAADMARVRQLEDAGVQDVRLIKMGAKDEASHVVYSTKLGNVDEYYENARAGSTATPTQTNQAQLPQASALGVPPRTPRGTATKEAPPQDKSSYTKTLAQKTKNVFTRVVEYVQNSEERVRQIVSRKDLDSSTDPYEVMTLFHGRVGAKIEQGYARAEEIAEDIISFAGRNRSAVELSRKDVNDYLQALHAGERNAALGDGAAGMKTADADALLKKASPEVKAVAQKALALNRETLDLLQESGVISKELHTDLRAKYKNHVPLQRVMDSEDDIGAILSGRGFDVRTTGLKKAVGSDREVNDILGNIINNYEQAVLRSEKNIVDRATLAFVRNNKDALSDLMTVTKPKMIGTKHDGTPILQSTNDPKILQLYEDGKQTWIEFKDPTLATAFRGVGREKMGVILNAVGAFTRFYSSLATRFNPEFALPNKLRDLQETMTYLAAQGDVGFKGATKAALRDPASLKAVLDGVRGADTTGAKLYQEMKSFGGTTGGLGLSTRKQTELNLDRVFSIARSRPRKALTKMVQYIDDWNTIFEDSTRLSVYKTALENGATKERAAFLAKEASINFNRSGQGGPTINALYMFANASIQGTTKMLRAMANPKVAAAVTAAIGSSVAAVSEWNDRIDPDWREKITEYDRMNALPVMLPSEDGTSRYFVIPVSWGLKPILVMSNAAYDAMSGVDVDAMDVTSKVLSSVLDAYNPVGGTDFTSALTPTIGDVPVEVARNQSWSGAFIRPIPYNNEPKDIQYFPRLTETVQGRAAIAGTKKLQEATGIAISPADVNYVLEQYMGGAGRSIKKTSEVLYGLTPAEDAPPPDEWPFVSRFLRERTDEEIGRGAGGEIEKLKDQLSDQARARFETKQEAEATYKTMKDLPPEVAAARYDMLKETNPELAQKIKEVAADEKKNLTYEDKLIQALGVDNGERARFLLNKFNEAKSTDAKGKLWEEYKAKGLISGEVAKQIKYLLNEQGIIN